MIDLYPDQQEFINEIKKQWSMGHKRIMGMAPTGFGKTRVAARIIEGCIAAGWRVNFVVPRITLIDQTCKSFIELGLEDITLIWGAYETNERAKITISSIDTFIRRERRSFDLVIIDEAHIKRKQILEWMDQFPDERYIGLSATPYSPWLGKYYQGLAKAKSMAWLIDNGRLAPYDAYSVSVPNLSDIPMGMGPDGKDYREKALADVMGEHVVMGNIVANWLENAGNKTTIALTVNKLHAGQISNEFNKAGVRCEIIVAETPVEERQAIIQRARDGITKVISSVNTLNEGFDLPECECLINARPTRSKSRFVQGMGRVLRYVPGKRAIIFDHSGTFATLGYPEDITIDELSSSADGMSDDSSRYEEELIEKIPKTCPRCKYLKPAGIYVCPKCGYKPIAGEDVETDHTAKLTKLSKDGSKTAPPTMEDKQKFYSELIGYWTEQKAKGKGWKEGWISSKYRDKFDVWPKGLSKISTPPSLETRNWIKSRNIAYAKSQSKAKS